MTLLDRLAPEARAAFLLREVFDAGYDELASTLGKSEEACRQLVHRAKLQLREARRRQVVPPETQLRLLRKHGETWLRINSLSTWRDVGLYGERERAAFNWAETMMRMVDHHGSRDADFEALQGQFSDQEIVELCWTVAQINAWNRMAVGMGVPLSEQPIE